MLFFGHVGITAGIVHAVNQRKRAPKINMRAALALSIAPDLIDKPLSIAFPEYFDFSTRLFAHSITFSIFVLALLLILRIRNAAWYWAVLAFHLVLDRIWFYPQSLAAFLWPFWKLPAVLPDEPLVRWIGFTFSHYNILGECSGLILLIFLKKMGGFTQVCARKY